MYMAIARDPKSPPRPETAAAAMPEPVSQEAGQALELTVEQAAVEAHRGSTAQAQLDLDETQRRLLGDLFAIVSEHAADSAVEIDRGRVQDAFVFACEHHADQRRKSGEDFIVHPVGVARICAGMRLDTETLCAALLHDTVEDTSASIEEVRERFGEEISSVVDGVTKLTGITFQSHDEAQAENYRKMMVAMATDVRVILIKLADRLHNMRTIDAMPKQKQMEKARETLEIYAPLAHRLGIHAIKWELEDLAFATLHPRKYQEIKGLVAQQRDDRERYVNEAGEYLARELSGAGDPGADRRSRQALLLDLLEDDQEGPRVQRDLRPHGDARDRGLGEGLLRDGRGDPLAVEAAARPLQGLHRDAQVQHVPVAAHDDHRPRGQARWRSRSAPRRCTKWRSSASPRTGCTSAGPGPPGEELGAAAAPSEDTKLTWLRAMLDWQKDLSDPREFMETLRTDLFEEEVYVFTPKGEVKSLAAGATPLDFAYEVHTEIGHRCVGARVNGKIVPLHYELCSGDIVEILTAKRERGPSRDWLAMVKTTRARNKIKQWFKAESRQDTEHIGRDLLQEHLRKQGLPAQKITGSALLADVIREVGYRKADDFYIALGSAKVSPKVVVNKVMQRLKQGEAADGEASASELLRVGRPRRRPTRPSGQYGIKVEGVEDVMLRLAKCCRPVPGDEIVGYISLGRGITIHREDCPNALLLRKDPERFTNVAWEGDRSTAFVVEIQIDAWDRHRLLEDLSRVFSESGANILEARCLSTPPMVKNRFVVEVADTHTLRGAITRMRNIESVFDAYRVTPGAGA